MNRKMTALLLVLCLLMLPLAGCQKKEAVAPEDPKAETSTAGTAEATVGTKYPEKPINLVLGFSAGGSSDVMVRILAAKLEKILGQPVVVVNKPGAGGWVCWEDLLKTVKPDGYTFSLINSPNVIMGAYDQTNPRPFTIDDFDVLANQVTDYNVLCIRNDETRYSDFNSLVEYAKENTLISAASAIGILSDDATVTDMMNKKFGTKFEIVQTGGAKESETFFISKDSDVLVANIADTFTAHKNGDYKIIAVFSAERSDIIPDVPTAKELGFDLVTFSSRGYALPKGVDPAIREVLLKALRESIQDPEIVQKMRDLGAATHYMEGEEYLTFLKHYIEETKKTYGVE